MTLNELRDAAHALALAKGWYEGGPRNVGELLALVHSELSEALEEYREGHNLQAVLIDANGKPLGFPVELADAVIRIADMCGALEIDLDGAVATKHAFNATRPRRHGGKRA